MCRYCYVKKTQSDKKFTINFFGLHTRVHIFLRREEGMERERKGKEKGRRRKREKQKNINRRTHDFFCLSSNIWPRYNIFPILFSFAKSANTSFFKQKFIFFAILMIYVWLWDEESDTFWNLWFYIRGEDGVILQFSAT